MKTILLASQNQHKYEEFKELLKGYDVKLLSLKELEDHDDVYEWGSTYEENASIKAMHFYKKYGMCVIADDSGIAIDYLNGFPNIHSARFLKHLNYDQKMHFILKIMEDIKDRRAIFTSVIVYIDENGKAMTFKGETKGSIALKMAGKGGFGYDPFFIPEGFIETYALMPLNKKNELSHRYKAFRKLVEYFEENS